MESFWLLLFERYGVTGVVIILLVFVILKSEFAIRFPRKK